MNPTSTPTDSTAEQLDRLIETIKKNDPVAANLMIAMETLFETFAPRKSVPHEVMCRCGGIAVWDYEEKQFTCFGCNRVWSA